MKWLLVVFCMFLIAPCFLSAGMASDKKSSKHEATWKSFNEAIDDKTSEIKSIVFGPITKIIGMLGIGYGVISMLLSASPKPLITYGGIGLMLNIVPLFIDSVFSATF